MRALGPILCITDRTRTAEVVPWDHVLAQSIHKSLTLQMREQSGHKDAEGPVQGHTTHSGMPSQDTGSVGPPGFLLTAADTRLWEGTQDSPAVTLPAGFYTT